MWDFLRPYISRIGGAIAGVVAAKISEGTGSVVDPSTLIGIVLGVYSVIHKLLDKKVNPSDAASATLAKQIPVAKNTI